MEVSRVTIYIATDQAVHDIVMSCTPVSGCPSSALNCMRFKLSTVPVYMIPVSE